MDCEYHLIVKNNRFFQTMIHDEYMILEQRYMIQKCIEQFFKTDNLEIKRLKSS